MFVGGSVELLGSLCFGSDCASNWASGGGSPFTYSAPYLYPDNNTDRIGIGTTTTGDMISRLYVTSPSAIGKALAIFNQTESQDILTASASGFTKFFIDNNGRMATGYSSNTGGTALSNPFEVYNEGTTQVASITTAGNLQIDGDLTVSGGDIDVSGEAANIAIADNTSGSLTVSESTNEYLNITTDNADTSVTLDLPVAGSSTTVANLFTSNIAKTINIGTGTAADAINIGTGGTAADTLTFGNTGVATTFTFNSGATTTTPLTFDFDTVTNTTAVDLSLDGLTSGTGLLLDDNTAAGLSSGTLLQAQSVTTDATAITDGLLGYFNWNPGSSTIKAGDLFRINIGSNGSVDNVFNVTDNGSTLFSVGEAGITSAVPHEFTAAGDVSIAYDIQFTNQTASYVKSYAPLYIQAGESFESNNLTLQTFNSGDIVFENGDSGVLANFGGDGTATITNTTDVLSGKSALIVDQKETEHIFTASASAATKFVIASDGKVYIGDNTTLATSTALCWASTTINGATVYQVGDCTGTPADLAEWYPAPSSDLPEPGDVLTIGESLGTYTTSDGVTHEGFSVKKADTAYDPKLIGVVSTKAFQTMGEDVLDWTDSAVQVGLVGRVPVKISPKSETIEVGDFITSSDQPGLAQKATVEGYTIGKALEKWTPDSGKDKILVYLNASVKLGDVANESTPATNDLISQEDLVFTGINATNSANLEEIMATELTVYGDTTLSDTVIAGNLNIGTIQVDGFGNSIDAVGTLKIQPLALGDVEIQGGLVKIDQLGNIVAHEITAKKYNVAGASAGTATISSGSKSVFVSTGLVTENSLIFVTPKQTLSYPLSVTNKDGGNGFTVAIPSSADSNIDFDWFIVDKK